MALSQRFLALISWVHSNPIPCLVFLILASIPVLLCFPTHGSLKHLPLLKPVDGFSPFDIKSKAAFVFHAKELLAKGRTLFRQNPYRMLTDLGEIVILPVGLTEEIKNDSRLSFVSAMGEDFHGNLPGFQGVALHTYDNSILQTVVRRELNKSIAQVVNPMSVEATHSLSVKLEWREVELKAVIIDVVVQLSACVFLGRELCRDEDWLRATKEYTVNFFVAGTHLRMIPRPLRPLLHWFVPKCRELRNSFNESRRIITPAIERRRAARAAALAAGEKIPEFHDAIDWADREAAAKGVSYDPAIVQLMLAVAAVHTTTDLVTQFMIDLALAPEFLAPIREEVIYILRTEGMKKSALYNMKLLDSALKESQRHKPPGLASMRRRAEKPITLSNGLVLKIGDRIAVDTYRMNDPELHKEPEKWDPYRFLRISEQPEKERFAQLVTTSPDHLAFGHGEHACPGRFFAACEIKIILCHLLLKYEWELVPGTNTAPMTLGLTYAANPATRMKIRRRRELEVDIDSL